jgi:serine protease Do
VAFVVTLLMASACESTLLTGDSDEPRPTTTLEQSDVAPPRSSVADVVEEVLPSVVNVRVKSLQPGFGGAEETAAQGSGVIIDPEGLIVTNFHVVRCAVEVLVVLNDGRKVEGRVVGTEPTRDLAVVRVDEGGLDAIELGRSSRLRLGDDVIALGFPLGLGGPTVTRGILSGKGRTIEPQGGPRLESLLQTDAAINPGNSGGALIDSAGRLAGINTAAAGAAAAENIGFAIPVDAMVPVVEDIVSGNRAWLGVQVIPVDSAAVAAQLELDRDVRGAAIAALLAGPAEGAGLKEGDVIVEVAGDEVESADDLTKVLASFSPGDEVIVEVVDPEGRRAVELELAERPPAEELNREVCGG